MKEEDKITDERVRQLFREMELANTPEDLNDRIMQHILASGEAVKKSPFYIRYSWALLIIAVSLLPFILKMVRVYLADSALKDRIFLNISVESFYLLVLIIFASTLLFIAERLIHFSFPRKTGLNL